MNYLLYDQGVKGCLLVRLHLLKSVLLNGDQSKSECGGRFY